MISDIRRSHVSMSLEEYCNEFLYNGDTDIFLVAISEEISTGAEDVASTLLLDQYEPILFKLGWDILSLLTPHLHPSQHHCWNIIDKIVMICSPKEMTLALLEQMETLSTHNNSHALFMMLKPLQRVLTQLENERAVDSTLHSVERLVCQHYSTLNSTRRRQPRRNESEMSCSDETSDFEADKNDHSSKDRHSEAQSNGHNSSELTYGKDTADDSVGKTSKMKDGENREEELDIYQAIDFVLQFLHPFVNQLHTQRMKDRICIKQDTHWSPKQREFISILVHMLDQPLVGHDMDKDSNKMNKSSRDMAESIMYYITMCHCGCIQLLTWSERSLHHTQWHTDEEDGDGFSLPAIGLACFAYLLFSEGMEESYYPAIMSPSYTFQLNLTHVVNLLEKPDKNITIKGLALLDSLLLRLSLSSLPSHALDDKIYLSVAKLLTNLMTTCPHKKVRKQSVPLLLKMIRCFNESGRHRLYVSLLHYVTHAGVKGLLLHNIKNEVDTALAETPPTVDCAFFGSKLVQLLELTVTVSEKDELLKEMDRIMPALNFIRYLLIRDKPELNITGIWNIIDHLKDKFISPLRMLLVRTRAQMRQELQIKTEERKLGRTTQSQSDEGADMTVEVMGKLLPDVSVEDEIKMLHSAQSHIDMVESILVRVEELAEYHA